MKRSRLISKSPLLAAATFWGSLTALPSLAVEDFWDAAANGTWSAGMNWLDGSVPDSPSHEATFSLPGTYTVSFPSDPQPIGLLSLEAAANITFASSARPPNPILPHTLRISNDNGGGHLNMSGGAALTLGATSGASNFPFHLAADGGVQLFDGSTLTARFGSHVDSSQVQVGVSGQSGAGTLTLSSGAVVTTNQVGIGNGGSSGVATVSGVGTRWEVANALQVGVTTSTLPGGGGKLTVAAGGVVQSGDAIVGLGPGGVTGTVTITGDAALWRATSLRIGGGGVVQIQPGGTLVIDEETKLTGGHLRLQGGTLDTAELNVGEAFEWTGGTLHVGTADGDFNHQAGRLAPGHSAGVTNVLGDYVQTAGGTLEMEIGGAAQGAEYDVLNSTEGIFVEGKLDLKLINGFVPTPSQSFVIMNSQALPISGAFSNVANGARLDVGGGGSFRVNYGAGSAFASALVVLSDFQASDSLGDFDLDGDVDGNDFLVWQRGGSPIPGSAADLVAWRSNFGTNGAAAASGSVPEPSGRWLAIVALSLAQCVTPLRRKG